MYWPSTTDCCRFSRMTDASDQSLATISLPQFPATDLETTSGSLLHLLPHLLERIGVSSGFMPAALYFANVILQFAPLLIGALISQVAVVAREGAHRIPFLLDLSALTFFLITYPCIFVLMLTDQQVLTGSLSRVQSGGTLIVSAEQYATAAERWRRRFRIINLTTQIFGLLLGGAFAYFNFKVFSPSSL